MRHFKCSKLNVPIQFRLRVLNHSICEPQLLIKGTFSHTHDNRHITTQESRLLHASQPCHAHTCLLKPELEIMNCFACFALSALHQTQYS